MQIFTKHTDPKSGNTISITILGPAFRKKRECWVTSSIFNPDDAQLEMECRKFCRKEHMKFIKGSISPPYEKHGWQHVPMYVFTAECTNKTSRIIYEFSKL